MRKMQYLLMPLEKSSEGTELKKKKRSLYLQACQTHASYNSDPGHCYKHRVIQVNRLSQVLAHRDKFKGYRTETPAIVLEIALYQCHT